MGKGARTLKLAGMGLLAFVSFCATLFIVGEVLGDPGGWWGVALIAIWMAPVVTLGLLTWRLTVAIGALLTVLALGRPRRAGALLTLLGFVPISLIGVGANATSLPLAVISVPILVGGMMILLSSLLPAPPTGRKETATNRPAG